MVFEWTRVDKLAVLRYIFSSSLATAKAPQKLLGS